MRNFLQLIVLLASLAVIFLIWCAPDSEAQEARGGDAVARWDVPLTERVRAPFFLHGVVERIIDGDTIKVRTSVSEEARTVRLIGIDTPETVHPRRPVECYGPEATVRMKNLLPVDTHVVLGYEWGDRRDNYGRDLAYVFLPVMDVWRAHPGPVSIQYVLINLRLIDEGYAKAYTDFSFKYDGLFRAAEEQAKEAGVGLWSACEED